MSRHIRTNISLALANVSIRISDVEKIKEIIGDLHDTHWADPMECPSPPLSPPSRPDYIPPPTLPCRPGQGGSVSPPAIPSRPPKSDGDSGSSSSSSSSDDGCDAKSIATALRREEGESSRTAALREAGTRGRVETTRAKFQQTMTRTTKAEQTTTTTARRLAQRK